MLHFKRFLSVFSVIFITAAAFYLYLPQHYSFDRVINETVGENNLDVLCVGSSHLFNGINPVQLYKDHGIAAYNVAGGSQAPWQSYYIIREVCKSQSPKMIIFDTYILGTRQDVDGYQDYQTVVNLLDFPFSMNKIKAVMESEAYSKTDILLWFPYTHDEAPAGFSTQKFIGTENILMGYDYQEGVEPYNDVPDVSNVTEATPLNPKNEKYLRLIIEYCRDNDIELLLVNTPWPCITEEYQKSFNAIGQIADEYDVPFVNGCLNYEDMNIDWTTDSYGDGGHMNHSGCTKYSVWLGDYLDENYSLPDRRGLPGYEAYDKGVAWLENAGE